MFVESLSPPQETSVDIQSAFTLLLSRIDKTESNIACQFH